MEVGSPSFQIFQLSNLPQEILETYFEAFMRFFFPKAAADIDWQWRLVRGLYERGYERQDILNLFHFIDWLMDLPDELELEFEEKVKAYEEAEQMPYISSIEQRGIQRGLEQGGVQKAQENIIDILKVRFGDVPSALIERINAIPYATTLNDLLKQAVISDSVVAFEQYIAANVPNGPDEGKNL